MNRKQKIIVSITGIFIVLLALVGLTYAYFLTRITGNENDKSISVTTANLELVYSDNSEEIIKGTGALMPTVETETDDAIGTKTFTVTNNGNDSSYVVIIDNVSVTKTSDGSSTTFVSNDFRYTLTCTVKDKSGNVLEGESCNQVSNLDTFPIKGGILVSNNILENKVHEYTLTLWYIDTGIDQSDDMGKSYQARVNIKDMTAVNPFQTGVSATDTTSLVYNIINNAKTNKNGTQFVNTPPSKVAQENILENWNLGEEEILYYDDESVVMYDESESDVQLCYYGYSDDCANYVSCTDDVKGKYVFDEATKETFYVLDCKNGKIVQDKKQYERVLAPTTDDYGTSYYFRGKVKDNYVNFANMCWRIVRIEGDGSVKLILEDRYTTCNDTVDNDGTGTTDYAYTGNWSDGNSYVFGYDSNYKADFLGYTQTYGLQNSFKTFQTSKLTSTDLQKLKVDEWCYDDKATAINSYECDLDYDGQEESQCTRGFYGAYTRIETNKKPSLNCTGTKLTKFRDNTDMYVGTLTADEMSFAGAYSTNYNYYLMNSYAKENDLYWWSLSPYNYDPLGSEASFHLNYDGAIVAMSCSADRYSRPAVSLKSGSVISSGEGTLEKPYVIN